MYLLSPRQVWRHASALALVSAFASAPVRAQQPQQTAGDSSKSKMPMDMQMGGDAHAVHGDTAMTDMKGTQIGTKMPVMGAHSTEDMMIGPAGVSMERMGSGTTVDSRRSQHAFPSQNVRRLDGDGSWFCIRSIRQTKW